MSDNLYHHGLLYIFLNVTVSAENDNIINKFPDFTDLQCKSTVSFLTGSNYDSVDITFQPNLAWFNFISEHRFSEKSLNQCLQSREGHCLNLDIHSRV